MDSRLRGKDGYGRVLQRSPEGERFKAAARGGKAGGEGAHEGRPYGSEGARRGRPGYSSLGASQMVWYWLPVMAAANSAVSSWWSSAMTSSKVFDISG